MGKPYTIDTLEDASIIVRTWHAEPYPMDKRFMDALKFVLDEAENQEQDKERIKVLERELDQLKALMKGISKNIEKAVEEHE